MAVGLKSKKVLLRRLSRQLKNSSFSPDHVCLFSEPKPSTLLRHKSILAFGDHLVYQAIGNVVADRLYGRVKDRYGVSVFGNLYSGPSSKFFLERWERSYQAFNLANRVAFGSGCRWLVQFDFASFYDSIGHGVLARLLMQLGVGSDVCKLLCEELLPRWSSAGDDLHKLRRITLDSGIAQGPLASPILAEAVLAYIDEQMVKLPNVKYLRYADDIRIWGISESDVRFAAAVLDRLARNIGIFPQSKKFGVDLVENVEDILKEVSIPSDLEEPDDEEFDLIEEELKGRNTIRALWSILREFAETSRIEDVTEFKFLLSASDASSVVGERLCLLMRAMPHLAEACCFYIERVASPSATLIDCLIDLSSYYPGYPWLSGRALRVLWKHQDALTTPQRAKLRPKVAELLKRRGIRSDCQVQGVALLMSSKLNKLRAEQLEKWIEDSHTSWWAIVHVVLNVQEDRVSGVFFRGLLQTLLGNENREIARASAHRLCQMGERVPNVAMDEDGECVAIFESFGLGARVSRSFSRINHLYSQILSNYDVSRAPLPRVGWQSLLGTEYTSFDSYATKLYGETRASGDLFIQFLDAAWEPVLDKVWDALGCTDTNHDGGRLATSSGRVRRAEKFRKNSDLKIRMPDFCAFLKATNDLRNHGHASHRHNVHTGMRNRPVSFGDVQAVLRSLPPAFDELASEFPEV